MKNAMFTTNDDNEWVIVDSETNEVFAGPKGSFEDILNDWREINAPTTVVTEPVIEADAGLKE